MHSIEKYKNRLRQAGYKLTHARVTTIKVLHDLGGHCTSTDVLNAVAERDEGIGRASVFRTLDLLTQLNIIRPTYIETSMTPHYVMLMDGHHHHIICTNCNRVIEFDDCGLSTLTERLQKEYNLTITSHLLEFYAVCTECNADA